MNVLFIYPNVDAQVGFNYGLAAMAAVLEARGHRTRLINLNDRLGPLPTDEDVLKEIEAFKPGLIGLSIVTTQYPLALRVAKMIKAHTDVPLIAGGVHVTMVPEDVMSSGVFDYACVGEGEDAILDLAEALERGGDTSHIPNVWARVGDKTIPNKVRPLRPLADLPRMHYDLFDFQRMIDVKNGWVSVMSSRGCPFRCTYCFNHRMVEIYRRDTGLSARELNYVRRLSPERMVDEMVRLNERYHGIRMFIFDDDLFTADNDYVREFCGLYRRKLDVPFVCNAHVRAFDEETARLLKSAGCRIVKFGLESGSERVRCEVMRRPMTDDDIRLAFAAAQTPDLHTSAFVMFGLPTETREEMMETIRLLADIRPGRFRWAIFFPFPGTDACDMALERGLIDRETMQSLSNFTSGSCLDFGEELNRFVDRLQRTCCWQVNAASGNGAASIYRGLVQMTEALSDEEWETFASTLYDHDRRISERLVEAGEEHYAIRYEKFMGVASSYFTRPDA